MSGETAEKIKKDLDKVDEKEGKPKPGPEEDRRDKFAKLHGEKE
jgi:hypothetical protein